ncbi:MAG: hypothetical protein ACW98Y_16895 [Candidatus Thorarchaeota archaeon]|jgi:hypothetical protein
MEISKFLKMSFLIDALIAIVYGLVMLVIPDIHANLMGFPYEEFADRMIGALFIGYGAGNLLAWLKASTWDQVELVVIMNLVFLMIGLGVMIYCIALAILPVMALLQTGLFILLLVLFLYPYYEAKMKSG